MAYPQKNRVKLSANELRKRFNRDVQPRIDKGLYQLNVYEQHPADPQYNQPVGTISTMFEVVDQHGHVVALAHVFVLPDGSYGAGGKLDPKRIRAGKTTYTL